MEWFEEWFGEEYLQLYPHRDDADAERAVALISRTVGLQPGWRVLDVACGAGRHARAFVGAGARCFGLDLTVNLFTSFGYFERDAEHRAALEEMIATVRENGWFVIDFLNPAAVRRRLVPEETLQLSGRTVRVSRSVSPDGRYVCKSIQV